MRILIAPIKNLGQFVYRNFLQTLIETNNIFCNDDGTRFFVIKRKEGDFSKTSSFLIEKAIQSVVGKVKSIKKLLSGELLIEIQNYRLATNLKMYPNC